MSQEMNQLKLYSLSEAATAMGIGRDTLRSLLSEGRIGFIMVWKSILRLTIVNQRYKNSI
jgi:excisionase family DNA binding protein